MELRLAFIAFAPPKDDGGVATGSNDGRSRQASGQKLMALERGTDFEGTSGCATAMIGRAGPAPVPGCWQSVILRLI
jgi:hypothetical protein